MSIERSTGLISKNESLSGDRSRDDDKSNINSENLEVDDDRSDQKPDQNLKSKINLVQDATKGFKEVEQKKTKLGKFFSVNLVASIETGCFKSVNDVFIKYSITAGPDWLISSGTEVGITQISRYKLNENQLPKFVWNQPIAISYRSYNYFGWPQIVLSVFNFDTLGNQRILGYGCTHLPITQAPNGSPLIVKIYAPQSTSLFRQIIGWITGRRPELVDSNLFARGDCRSVLQVVEVGSVELVANLTTKDAVYNGYVSG